jgi:hypothetical protein
LLETVVGRLDPPFRLSKLEGDAAFLWVEDGRAEGQLLLDAVEAAYLAFRRRLRSIDQATSCDCRSCRLAPRLDLKLFIHHGTYVVGRIAGREELAGPDVIVVHRLLKGVAASRSRGNGFALFTEAAATALCLDPAAGLEPGQETIEHLGSVSTLTLDLEERWQRESGRRRLDAADGQLVLDADLLIRAEPSVVWAYLTSPSLRSRWEGPIAIEEVLTGGRRGVGTTTQCVSGRLATLEEIVDWQPYEHAGWRLAVPSLGPVEAVADLRPVGEDTRLRVRWVCTAGPVQPGDIGRVRADREQALQRLRAVAARGDSDQEGTDAWAQQAQPAGADPTMASAAAQHGAGGSIIASERAAAEG